MNKPLINILSRVTRPKYFEVLKSSVESQTYRNFQWIVGSDNNVEGAIVLKEVHSFAPVPAGHYYAYWNNYLNQLQQHCNEGWIMQIDDDDQFYDKHSLQTIADNCQNDNEILVWKVMITPNWIVPSHSFGKTITPADFSGIGFCYHSKWNPVDWGFVSYGDYRVGQQLLNKGLKIRWIDQVLTKCQDGAHNGRNT